MKRSITVGLLGAVMVLASALPATAKPDPICTYVPDLDGNVYGPVCIDWP